VVESNNLEVVHCGVPLSLMEMYQYAIHSGVSICIIAAYLELKRLGYIVCRTEEFERNRNYQEFKRLKPEDKIKYWGTENPSILQPVSNKCEAFYVWLPERCASFKRSNPPLPDFSCIACRYAMFHLETRLELTYMIRAETRMPSMEDVKQWKLKLEPVPLRMAVYQQGSVSFIEMADIALPNLMATTN
jgi:hypothetical protein